MPITRNICALGLGLLVGLGFLLPSAEAWDYEVHRLITRMALEALPTNFPACARSSAARERIAFLSGEPDRWRNTPDMPLRHRNGPDHYFDAEDLSRLGLTPEMVSPFRYDFVTQLAFGRALHATNFPPPDPARDLDHTRALIGFLPWTITEYYGELKSTFSYLREYEERGAPEEIENARLNVVYAMGVMGHFVGDATQPLHVTIHYNGWVGKNPNQYTTERTFHGWIDSGFLRAVGVKTNEAFAGVRPAHLPWDGRSGPNTNIFPRMLDYVLDAAKLVEPLYQMEKEKKFSPGAPEAEAGRDFLTGQLVKAAQMLADLWLAAWQEAPPDSFLQKELLRRQNGTGPRSSP